MRELVPPPGGVEASGYTSAEWKLVGDLLQPFNIPIAGVEKDELQTAASGVCISVSGHACVLTAYHVLYGGEGKPGILDFPGVSLLSSRWDRQTVYPKNWFSSVRIAGPPRGENGPDLAALILPDRLKSDLEARARSFYNMDLHKTDSENVALDDETLGWILAGIPKERWRDEEEGIGVEHLFGRSSYPKRHTHDGFEFLDIRASYVPPCNPPKSFEGMSGGGLWALRHGKNAEDWKVILMGIAFYQMLPAETYCDVRCHGPADVYRRSYDAILEALKSGG
jgi:hypothetical protein